MNSNEQSDYEVVRGIVLPTVWGAMGEPRLVAILTADEGEYNVAPTLAGVELLSHLKEEVEARILAKTGEWNRSTVTVVSFEVIGPTNHDSDVDFADQSGRADRGSPGRPGG